MFFYAWPENFYDIFISFSLTCYPSKQPVESDDGYRFYRSNRSAMAGDQQPRCRVRQTGEEAMNPFYLAGAVVAAGLLVYLIAALLKAEDL